MKKSNIKKTVLGLFISLSLCACSKSDSDDDNGPVANRRNVKFEVIGNFTGTLDATYVAAGGGGVNEPITGPLPWTKDITYASTVAATSLQVGGPGGVAGQTIRVRIITGGVAQPATTATADASGRIVAVAPTYIFP